MCARLETAGDLSDEDRKTIIEIARLALAHFQPKPETRLGREAGPKPEHSQPKTDARPKPETALTARP